MKLTPLDIHQQQFRTSLLGFDSKEVDAFLDVLATELEGLTRENKTFREDLKRKEIELQGHRDRERTLKETMVTATRITEDIKENARKESEIVIAGAKNQAEQIIQNAHTRLVRIMGDIDELRRQKAQFEASLRSTIEAHAKLLDAMNEVESHSEIPSVAWIRPTTDAKKTDAELDEPHVVALRKASGNLPDSALLTPRGGDR